MSARRKQTSHVDCANMSFNLPCPYKGNHKKKQYFQLPKCPKFIGEISIYQADSISIYWNFNLPRAREIETHVRE